MAAAAYNSPFSIGDKVCIDGDQSIIASVTGVAFYPGYTTIQLGWVHCGDAKSYWIDAFRLTIVGAAPRPTAAAAEKDPEEDYPRLLGSKGEHIQVGEFPDPTSFRCEDGVGIGTAACPKCGSAVLHRVKDGLSEHFFLRAA